MSEQITPEETRESSRGQSVVEAANVEGASAQNKRLLKLETHSRRNWSASFMALIWGLGALYLMVQSVRQFLGYRSAGFSFEEILVASGQLPKTRQLGWVIAVAVAFLLLGVFCLVKALGGGALKRHGQADNRAAFVVDDAVIASAISKAVREEAGLGRGQVTTAVAKNEVKVQVKPTSGLRLSTAAILEVAKQTVSACQLDRKMKVTVQLTETGMVAK